MKKEIKNSTTGGVKIKTLIFCLFCLFLIQAVHADIQDGRVFYYPFNGNANDESGYENHGSVHRAALIADRFGNPDSAYNFNMGNSISTSIGPELSLQNISVSLWVYNPDGTSTWNPRLIAIGPDYGRYFNIHLLKRSREQQAQSFNYPAKHHLRLPCGQYMRIIRSFIHPTCLLICNLQI